jgi:hypothetical protein
MVGFRLDLRLFPSQLMGLGSGCGGLKPRAANLWRVPLALQT